MNIEISLTNHAKKNLSKRFPNHNIENEFSKESLSRVSKAERTKLKSMKSFQKTKNNDFIDFFKTQNGIYIVAKRKNDNHNKYSFITVMDINDSNESFIDNDYKILMKKKEYELKQTCSKTLNKKINKEIKKKVKKPKIEKKDPKELIFNNLINLIKKIANKNNIELKVDEIKSITMARKIFFVIEYYSDFMRKNELIINAGKEKRKNKIVWMEELFSCKINEPTIKNLLKSKNETINFEKLVQNMLYAKINILKNFKINQKAKGNFISDIAGIYAFVNCDVKKDLKDSINFLMSKYDQTIIDIAENKKINCIGLIQKKQVLIQIRTFSGLIIQDMAIVEKCDKYISLMNLLIMKMKKEQITYMKINNGVTCES